MGFDAVFDHIGSFGRYQITVVLITSIISGVYLGFVFFSTFFLFLIPDHRCAIPGLENDTFAVQDEYHQMLINMTIPLPSDNTLPYDGCHVFPGGVEYDVDSRPVNASAASCNRWVYDDSLFEETLGSYLNIVCDRKVYKSNAQMLFFAGVLTGSFVTGLLSDRFGRRPVCCIFSMLLGAVFLCVAWTPNYIVYIIFNYLIGTLSVGNFMPSFVLSMEFVGQSHRKIASQIGSIFWVSGQMLLSLMAYRLRHWHRIQLACAISGVSLLSYWWVFPESARWLFSVGRFEESERMVNRIAKCNRKELPSGFFAKLRQESSDEPTGKLWHLFSTKRLCLRTLVIFVNWVVVCMAYYGLALNSGNLGGNLFVNFALNSLMDLPASLLTVVLIDRMGRKPLHVSCMVLGGVACLSTIFSTHYGGKDLEPLTITMAMIGKIGVSAGFSTIYIYSAELYPTQVRNAGMGASSCMARIGGMVSPYVADLGNLVGGTGFGKALPMIIFGGLSLGAGTLALTLPETYNRNLPETIQDAEEFGGDKSADLKKKDTESYFNGGFNDLVEPVSRDTKF